MMLRKPSRRWRASAGLTMALVWIFLLGSLPAQQTDRVPSPPSAPAVTDRESDAPPAEPPPLFVYEGRVIAQTMHYLGAEWLIRDSREREERCSLLLTNLGIKPGMTVCDMGCGNGFYAIQIAKMVGDQGKVLGVDIQPEMLEMLKKRAADQKVSNVVPILGKLYDPQLPAGEVDLILCVDVYHEFSHPVHMLAAMRQSLSPQGVVALVEYRAEDPNVPIKPEHKMTKKQILKEWRKNGFKLVKEFEGLPWQHLMFFAKAE